MSTTETLSIWTIYDHPRDFPDAYVARRFEYDRATGDVMLSADLGSLRDAFQASGLVCITRHPTDDPVILETWL